VIHITKDNAEYDKGRTYELQELGVTLLRFWNDEVMNEYKNGVR